MSFIEEPTAVDKEEGSLRRPTWGTIEGTSCLQPAKNPSVTPTAAHTLCLCCAILMNALHSPCFSLRRQAVSRYRPPSAAWQPRQATNLKVPSADRTQRASGWVPRIVSAPGPVLLAIKKKCEGRLYLQTVEQVSDSSQADLVPVKFQLFGTVEDFHVHRLFCCKSEIPEG